MKKSRNHMGICLLTLLALVGCASTKVTDQESTGYGKLPPPNVIWVYDFAATAADVPAESALAGQLSAHNSPQTEEHIAAGRKAGAEIASALVDKINDMGLSSARASSQTKPQINDIVIKGYFLSIEEGSAGKRFAIGFGSGTSELNTVVEGFQMTTQGLRKLGSGTLDSTGAKGPGEAVPLAVFLATKNPLGLIITTGAKIYGEESGKSKIEGRAEQTAKEIVDHLKVRFQEQGWI
jgi:hypothetical protein